MVIGFMRIRAQDIIPHRVNSLADNHDSLAWYFPMAVTAVSIDMSLVLGIITETRPKSGDLLSGWLSKPKRVAHVAPHHCAPSEDGFEDEL